MDEQLYRYIIDLQLFADGDTGEKTEKATPRKREEARKKGQVFKSSDLNAAIILIAGSVAIFLSFPYMLENMEDFTRLYLTERALHEFNNKYAYSLMLEILHVLLKITFPVLLTTSIAALLISYLQVGFLLSFESIAPKLSKLNPIEGAKRIFSKRAVVELIKSLLKVCVTGYIVYSIVRKNIYLLPRFVDMSVAQMLQNLIDIVLEMALEVGVVFIIIGVIDYLYQWYEHEKSLMMSKYDVKQEYKQVEGDPTVKSRQRQIQREAAMQRMMSEVPNADVVITNPTHFAVVLKYDSKFMDAPLVVAKGQDYIALKIREIARENNVTIVENPPLARNIFHNTEIGDLVPEDLYQAVAEVLAFVYKQKKLV